MKRRIIFSLLALMLVCQSFSIAAHAEVIGNSSTIITYTKEAESGGSSGSTSTGGDDNDTDTSDTKSNQGPLFEIYIPSEISLSNSRTLSFSASTLNLEEGQSVIVYLDGDSTFEDDGYLHLRASGLNDVRIAVNRQNQAMDSWELIGGGGLFPVAVFSGNDLQPEQYGTLNLNLIEQSSIAAGQYTGVMHFVFELQ